MQCERTQTHHHRQTCAAVYAGDNEEINCVPVVINRGEMEGEVNLTIQFLLRKLLHRAAVNVILALCTSHNTYRDTRVSQKKEQNV